MSAERSDEITPRMQSALSELQELIHTQHPTATFEVTRAEDDPNSIHLQATVDVDDPDQVLDLVIDRVLEFQVEERLPVHVIPLRPLERVAPTRRAHLGARAGRARQEPRPVATKGPGLPLS